MFTTILFALFVAIVFMLFASISNFVPFIVANFYQNYKLRLILKLRDQFYVRKLCVYYNIILKKITLPVKQCVAIRVGESLRLCMAAPRFSKPVAVQCSNPEVFGQQLCWYHLRQKSVEWENYHVCDKWDKMNFAFNMYREDGAPLMDDLKVWHNDVLDGKDYYWAIATELFLRKRYASRYRKILKPDWGHENWERLLMGRLNGRYRPTLEGIGDRLIQVSWKNNLRHIYAENPC